VGREIEEINRWMSGRGKGKGKGNEGDLGRYGGESRIFPAGKK